MSRDMTISKTINKILRKIVQKNIDEKPKTSLGITIKFEYITLRYLN